MALQGQGRRQAGGTGRVMPVCIEHYWDYPGAPCPHCTSRRAEQRQAAANQKYVGQFNALQNISQFNALQGWSAGVPNPNMDAYGMRDVQRGYSDEDLLLLL